MQNLSRIIGWQLGIMFDGENSYIYDNTGNIIMYGINVIKYPQENDVKDGVVYGSNEQFTGTLQLPPESVVLKGYKYGSNTGTLEPSEMDENILLKIFKKALIWFENRHEKHLKIT